MAHLENEDGNPEHFIKHPEVCLGYFLGKYRTSYLKSEGGYIENNSTHGDPNTVKGNTKSEGQIHALLILIAKKFQAALGLITVNDKRNKIRRPLILAMFFLKIRALTNPTPILKNTTETFHKEKTNINTLWT